MKSYLAFFLFVLGIIFWYALDFALLLPDKFFISLSIIFVIYLLLTFAFLLKIVTPYFPSKMSASSKRIYAIIFDIFFLSFSYLMLPLSFFRPKVKSGRKTPILLVHGYANSSAIWIYQLLSLKKRGLGPIYTINLGYPFSSIEKYSEKLKKKIEEIGSDKIILIGHSMGGLVASYCALNLKPKVKVTDIITIGSPLHGTKVAILGPGKCAKEMRYQSEFTRDLVNKIKANKSIRFFCIGSKVDHVVVPNASSLLGDRSEDEYLLDDIDHVSMVFQSKISNKIAQWLI